MINKIRDFLRADKEYFLYGKREIAAHNNQMLVYGCVIYAGVLALYTVVTGIAVNPDVLKRLYYVFDVLHAALCVCVFVRRKKGKSDCKSTRIYCVLLEALILSFFVLEAVYTSKTQPALYIPIAILLILLLFVHNVLYANVITLIYVASYAVLSRLYKTPEAYTSDFYIAIATLIAANIGNVLISKKRHGESAALRKYESLSKLDPLTGLYNRAAMETLCGQSMALQSDEGALIILDIDGFKAVNDTYGHGVGDEVLCKVAQTLRTCFREMDHVGRYGGDEFIVFMSNCKDRLIVEGKGERIIELVAGLRFSEPGLSVKCSAGIAMKRGDDDFQAIFKRADQALYEAKAEGKGRCRMAEGD